VKPNRVYGKLPQLWPTREPLYRNGNLASGG